MRAAAAAMVVLCLAVMLALITIASTASESDISGHSSDGFQYANATSYDGIQTNEDFCGYQEAYQKVYGPNTTALSSLLFGNGETCGACFEIRCVRSKWCRKNAGPITVTATDSCPPDPYRRGLCNPQDKFLFLPGMMFQQLAISGDSIVSVMYRTVKCSMKGGIKFDLFGTTSWLELLVYNVGGTGGVAEMKIKVGNSGWMNMVRHWGQKWEITGQILEGQSLSFQVKTSDGKMVQCDNVAPSNWKYAHTYECARNFN